MNIVILKLVNYLLHSISNPNCFMNLNFHTPGLERMFSVCGAGLEKLRLIGCTKGPFDQICSLRLVASYCSNLKHIDASYTQAVCDQSVITLAKSITNLVSVKLNGAQNISNTAIQHLVQNHHHTLVSQH